jgi:hypothetical protein
MPAQKPSRDGFCAYAPNRDVGCFGELAGEIPGQEVCNLIVRMIGDVVQDVSESGSTRITVVDAAGAPLRE